MTTSCISIRGVDTLLFRDGRPFDATPGGRAETLRIPAPSTVAGFVRAKIGKHPDSGWDKITDDVRLRGPLLARLDVERSAQTIVYPAPADAVVYRSAGAIDSEETLKTMMLRPLAEGSSISDIPGGMRVMEVKGEEKPETGYAYWTAGDMDLWLRDEWPDGKTPCRIEELATDARVHVQIGSGGVADDGKLFITEMVSFERHVQDFTTGKASVSETWSLLCKLDTNRDTAGLAGPGQLGGESRTAIVEAGVDGWPVCSEELKKRLRDSGRVRMVLATPAVFELGWLPQWLDATTKIGAPPGIEGDVQLKLVAACVPRRQAISGWDYSKREEGNSKKPGGPKPVRWLAPAGSVYFFEVVSGSASVLADKCWLEPVSDPESHENGNRVENNRNDGFRTCALGEFGAKRRANHVHSDCQANILTRAHAAAPWNRTSRSTWSICPLPAKRRPAGRLFPAAA
nr:hypothetical protein Hi04_10k_c2089_00018 [uncultured bacterium]